MLYFVCFIFWYSVIFDYFCSDFIVGLFTGGRGVVIVILGRFDAWRDFRVAAGGAGLGCWWCAWYMGVASQVAERL